MKALIVIDVQNDFCPGGALPVPAGDEVVPVVNALAERFECIVATQDWHPAGHISFASAHGGKPGDTVSLPEGEQMMWPDHCVQGSPGADFHPDLDIRKYRAVFHKGMNPELDSYSAFFENDGRTVTGLSAYLRGLGVTETVLCGLATDYCVFFSAMDALRENFTVTVVSDACRGVGVPDGSVENAMKRMSDAGVRIVESRIL